MWISKQITQWIRTKAHTCAWQAIAASFGRQFPQDGSEMIGVIRWWGGDLFRQLATGGHHSARVGTTDVHYLIIVFQEVHQSDAGFSIHWAFEHQWCHFAWAFEDQSVLRRPVKPHQHTNRARTQVLLPSIVDMVCQNEWGTLTGAVFMGRCWLNGSPGARTLSPFEVREAQKGQPKKLYFRSKGIFPEMALHKFWSWWTILFSQIWFTWRTPETLWPDVLFFVPARSPCKWLFCETKSEV